jgi:putative peptide zinc metalloprotease protein
MLTALQNPDTEQLPRRTAPGQPPARQQVRLRPRRTELIIRPLGENGPYVLKDPRSGAYYHLGPEEYFLLTQLDGRRDAEAVRTAFAESFGQSLSAEDLQEFLDMASAQGFLQAPGGEPEPPEAHAPERTDAPHAPADTAGAAPLGLRLLYWRKSLFDPDRLFTWLAPKIGFFWTPAFVFFSAGCIVLATALLWANRQAAAGSFLSALRWETAVLAWLALMAVTICHEFAHGLTCKRHGGEVHEVGFLMLLLMPCFYCNVSDAWLFKEKSRRLWVTLAGGYFELFLWALAVFAWRLTLPGTLPHYLALLVVSACGVQTLFNFNPLIKLDGYYLLSDWLEIPNLQQRAAGHVKARVRWLLWGAGRPAPDPRGRVLLAYGLVSWLYSLAFLALMLVGLLRLVGPRAGVLGLAGVGLLGLLSARGVFHEVSAGEVYQMIRKRHTRAAGWALLLGAVPAALFYTPWEDRAGGSFQVRPATHCELRARVAGFIGAVLFDEGERVPPGAVVVQIEVPELASRLAQKRAEVREARARLRMLEVGTRYEELAEQRGRVRRAEAWRDLARQDLGRERRAYEEDLTRLDKEITRYAIELDQAQVSLVRTRKLAAIGAASPEELGAAQVRYRINQAQREQAEAEKRARRARGTLQPEAELVRREQELADARSVLVLMEAGSRPEQVEAERGKLARLEEEARYLDGLRDRLSVAAPAGGVVTTARLKEKVGQYVKEGDLIGVVEEPAAPEVEIALAEQDLVRVQRGQPVELKARAQPFATFTTRVDRIAPAATRGEVQGTVLVYCRLTEPEADLRPGMTGYARICTGRRSAGAVLLDHALRYLRTEFWW